MYFFLTSLVTSGVFLYLYFFWNHITLLAKVYGFLNYFSFIISYTYTAIINPGYPMNSKGKRIGQPREEYRFCSECKFWVHTNKKVNHCLDCNICIEGYDHHCPWTSKCIGKKNRYSFYGFIGSIMLLFAFFLIGIITTPS